VRLCEPCFSFPDADELEWYIPAGINLPDLQQSLTVIEQFEKSPLDLDGKRASQLLQKKRRQRQRRRRRRRQPSSSDSEDGEGESNDDSDAPRKARKARERETYKSAQFIEDSDEEYERDIDAFFAREAELRKRTALTAASVFADDSAADGQQGQEHRHLGTMRATGTKKRRRAQVPRDTSAAPRGRAAKRRAVVVSSRTPGKVGEGEQQLLQQQQQLQQHGGINAAGAPRRSPSTAAAASFFADGGVGVVDDDGGDSGEDEEDEEDDDDDDAQRSSSIVDRDVGRHRHADSLVAPESHRPRARPLYRRGASLLRSSPTPDAVPSTTPVRGIDRGEDQDEDEEDAIGAPTSVSSLRVVGDEDGDEDEEDLTRQTKGGSGGGGDSSGANAGGPGLRKGRLIISDDEE
jgi:hypothetical protein